MIYILVLTHLLGDYVFQFNCIARWKARSLWGVVAHGGIVTLVTLVCVALTAPVWWPYALLIGLLHTGIDIARTRLVHPQTATEELNWFLLDQFIHLVTLVGTALWGNAPNLTELSGLAAPWIHRQLLSALIGYIFLLQPAWVFLRFIVRGIYGGNAAPHLGIGEKYAPMAERLLMATLALTGPFYLAPLVLLPRRVTSVKIQNNGVGVMMQLTAHWAETVLSLLLAMSVGVGIRLFSLKPF